MYSLIFKMQLKRIWMPYLAVSILFIAGFLFVPVVFTLYIFSLFFFAIMSGICISLAYWSFPKTYIATLPVKINACRMALHVTPIILTALSTLVLILCFVSGLRGFILWELYGYGLFANIKHMQIELLFLGLFFQIFTLHVTYFTIIYNESSLSKLSGIFIQQSAIIAMINSFSSGAIVLIFFSSAQELSPLLLLSGAILISSMFLPYLNPFGKDIIIDSHLTGGTYSPDRKKLFFYSLTWGIIILLLCLFWGCAFPAISTIPFLFHAFIFTAVLTGTLIPINTFLRERQAGTTVMKSLLSSAAGTIFPPLLPFIYSYRFRNSPRLKALLNKYYKKHGPIQPGQVIDYKKIYEESPSRKMASFSIFIFILLGIFTIFHKSSDNSSIEIVSKPSGLEISFYNEKTKETITITTPAEIKYEAANTAWQNIKAPGFKLIEKKWNFVYKKRILNFVNDKEMEELKETLKNIKEAGTSRNKIINELSPEKLFTMIRFFNGVCNNKSLTFNSVADIFFTEDEYGNILDALVGSYVSSLSEEEASGQILAMIKEDGLTTEFLFLSGYFEEYKIKLFQNIVARFENLRKEYRNKIIANPYAFFGFNSALEDFLFKAFSKYPDKALTEFALLNATSTFLFVNATNKMYAEYLFRNWKDSADYSLIVKEAIRTSKTMHTAYGPLEFIAASGSPLALEEIKTRLKKDSKRDSLYQVIVKSYPPEEAYSFIDSVETDLSLKDKAFCFMKTPQVTEYFQKKGDEVLKEKRLLECIGASQNEYLFPVLISMKSNYDKITETICKFDGKLTEMWTDHIRKEGGAEEKEFLEKTLKNNASCFQKKQN